MDVENRIFIRDDFPISFVHRVIELINVITTHFLDQQKPFEIKKFDCITFPQHLFYRWRDNSITMFMLAGMCLPCHLIKLYVCCLPTTTSCYTGGGLVINIVLLFTENHDTDTLEMKSYGSRT